LAWEGLAPPNKNIAAPNEMKPISPFELRLMFFARFVLKKYWVIVFDELKETDAGRIFSLKLQLKFIQISPPKQKSWLHPCVTGRKCLNAVTILFLPIGY